MRHLLLLLALSLVLILPAMPADSATGKPHYQHNKISVKPFVPNPVVPIGPVRVTHATWYGGSAFFGRTLKSGRRYAKGAMFVAHRSYRMGTILRITNLANHRSIVVPVEDRGPYAGAGRDLDLSYAAAVRLGTVTKGVVWVAYVQVAPATRLKGSSL